MGERDINVGLFWPLEKSPEAIGRRVAADLLSRPLFMLYEAGGVRALHYAEVCAAFGAAHLAGLLADKETLRALAERYAPDKLPPNTADHVDANVYGTLPLELYLQNGDERRLEEGLRFADGQWLDPRPDGLTGQTRFWVDDMWMIGSLQIAAWRATRQAVYLERAARELAAYLEKLQQPSGLFYHGLAGPHCWGRGNGWAAAALAELLSVLPESNGHYPALVAGFRKQADALLFHQSAAGLWRQLIDRPQAWVETSGSAMFGYAIRLGVRRRLLSPDRFVPAYRKAWLALTDFVTEDGRLREVCAGTAQNGDTAYYLARPRVTGDLHGQAPLLWFASSLLSD